MNLQTDTIADFMRGFRPKVSKPPEPSRKRGRPRKRTESLYATVMRGHQGMAAWFRDYHQREARSDAELLQAFRDHVRKTAGLDARSAQVLALGYTLKTVQNLLGEARRFYREHPEKCPFLGVDGAVQAECNQPINQTTK